MTMTYMNLNKTEAETILKETEANRIELRVNGLKIDLDREGFIRFYSDNFVKESHIFYEDRILFVTARAFFTINLY